MDFHFQQFSLKQAISPMKIGTDGVLLGAWADCTGSISGLDIGTGTGLIALMMVQKCSTLHMTGIEPNKDAFKEASINFENSPWPSRINVYNKGLQEFEPGHPFDLIISNPPFYNENVLSSNSGRSQARHSSHLSGEDLLENTQKLLTEQGKFQVILPEKNVVKFILQASERGLYLRRQLLVYPGKTKNANRRLMEFRRHRGDVTQEKILLRNGNGYSNAYRKLTSQFFVDL